MGLNFNSVHNHQLCLIICIIHRYGFVFNILNISYRDIILKLCGSSYSSIEFNGVYNSYTDYVFKSTINS